MVNFQKKEHYNVEDLRRLMALLRQPDGCPWDRAQTHASIRANMLEEAYEAADAIDRNAPEDLKEELGDVLLQVVFHARMEEEAGLFDLDDVADGICKKLIFRHPFLFEQEQGQDAGGALTTWEERKRLEKGQRSAGEAMESVARALPALTRAEKIQSKAARAGFDWPDIGPAMDKVGEELDELRQAVDTGTNVEEELGDLLFAAAKVGRFAGVDPELALQGACDKFIRRFRGVERLTGDKPLEGRPIEELNDLWRQAKEHEDL